MRVMWFCFIMPDISVYFASLLPQLIQRLYSWKIKETYQTTIFTNSAH